MAKSQLNYEKCSVSTNQKILTLKEKRSKFVVNNPDERTLVKIQVDGCLIDDERSRCDFIVEVEESKAMYVELKGCELDKAIKQLSHTIELTRPKFSHHQKSAYVVTTRVPKQDNRMLKHRKDFDKKYQTKIMVKNNQMTVDV